ncbi:MAG: hypothetical protein AB1640_14285 [bacterium]
MQSLESVSRADLDRLSNSRIFFGHQSVGYDLMEGVASILNRRGDLRLNVVESDAPQTFGEPVWAHARVGQNRDPVSKIHAFRTVLEGGAGDKVDVAFFKFCFVDVKRGTDVEALFEAYRSHLESLKARFPRVQFVHVTVPLMTCPQSFASRVKRRIKTWLGRTDERAEDNLSRCRYNRLLVKEYAGKDPIFDLALIESQSPDGRRAGCAYRGEEVSSLAREYSRDGGHLNEQGQVHAAEQLLVLLAGIRGNDGSAPSELPQAPERR